MGKHVVRRGEKWGVLTSGATRVAKVFETQREAISSARNSAKKEGTELYVHGRDGRIRERSSFGSDSHPPKG